jgi:hypothetical protein
MITKIVKISLHLSFIKIYCIFLNSLLTKFTEMRYDVLPGRCYIYNNYDEFPNRETDFDNNM